MEDGSSIGGDGLGGSGFGRGGMAMGTLAFSVEEVGRGGRERVVNVRPGTRRTTSFWMDCGF
jgi:hypothetical protein